MKILSIDTSTQCASCALIDGTRLLGEISFNYKKQHSVLMMDMIDSLLKTCGTDVSDLDGYVVSKGPGSFTGLRIGTSTIKSLAHGSKKPFVSVSSLDALAYNVNTSKGIVCSIIDALRDHVYYGIYRFDTPSQCSKLCEIDRSDLDSLLAKLSEYDESVTFVGDCLDKFGERINAASSNFTLSSYNNSIVRASSLGYIGMRELEAGNHDNLFDSTPIYLVKSQAEREYEERIAREK